MPDWAGYVRQNLRLSGFNVERETGIIEELAQQLEDAYIEALRQGLTPAHADAAAKRHIADWDSFAKQIESSRSGRESSMSTLLTRAEDHDIAKHGKFSLFTGFMQDIHFGIRMLRKN